MISLQTLVILHFSGHFIFHLYRSLKKNIQKCSWQHRFGIFNKNFKTSVFVLLRLMLSWNMIIKNWKLSKLAKNFIFSCFLKCYKFLEVILRLQLVTKTFFCSLTNLSINSFFRNWEIYISTYFKNIVESNDSFP